LDDAFAETVRLQLFAPSLSAPLDRFKHSRRSAGIVLQNQARLGRRGLLIVDGLEQLWRSDRARLRRRMTRRNQTLLATSHAPLAGLTTLHRTSIDGELVASLTESLMVGASPAVTKVVHRELRRQDWSRLTNVRELWFELYDIVQPHFVQSQIASTEFLLPRNLRDGRSLVRHHGPHCVAESGRRMDG
jgi:hypothetical protein